MDFEGHKDREYLRRYYAGQALVGLLANRELSHSLATVELGRDEKGVDELATLACDIAEGMVQEVTKRSQ